jgi:Holliday junction resolvase RusA-like endonuclease
MKYLPRKLEDTNKLFFSFPFHVEPKQSTRFGKGIAYKKDSVKDFERKVKFYSEKQLREQGSTQLTGGIHYVATYFYKIVNSHYKWAKDAVKNGGKVYKETQPDLTDNMNKGIVDTIAPLIMANDGQIAKVSCEKFWAKEDRIECAFYELPNPL